MLLRRVWPLLVATACTTDEATAPPTIAEPAAGVQFDRALVRARINPPVGLDDNAVFWGSSMNTGHGKWRIDDGPEIEPLDFAGHADESASYAFSVRLPEGSHRLSLARCTEIDDCGWSTRAVEVVIRPGSPDPRFAGVGQAALRTLEGVGSMSAADGGMVLVASGDRIVAIGPDGGPATGFGTTGVSTFSPSLGYPYLARGDANTFAVVWATASSATFARIGVNGAFSGQLEMSLPDGLVVAGGGKLVEATGGGFWLGCDVRRPDSQVVPALVRLDSNGVALSATLLDGVPGIGQVRAWHIDRDGNVAILGAGKAIIASAAGVDLSFASGGYYAFTNSYAGTIARHGDGIALVPLVFGPTPKVELVSHSGVVRLIDLPLIGIKAVLAPSRGTLYVAGQREQVVEGNLYDPPPMLTPTNTAVARIIDGAIDPSFGTAGIAWSSGRLLFQPIEVEPTVEIPQLIGGDATGPYVVSATARYRQGANHGQSLITITRFKD